MAPPGQPLLGIQASNHGQLVIFPITARDEVIGAVGCSGGTPDRDHVVCAAGVAACP